MSDRVACVTAELGRLRVSTDGHPGDPYVVTFSDLPEEVVLLIFSFLYVEDLMVMGAVCRLFRAIAKDHGLAHNYRRNINVSVIGGCGAGKSTLVGHLLLQLGEVKLSAIREAQGAANSCKEKYPHAQYTFIVSRRKLDRERGITTDNNYVHAFNSRHPLGVTFIDTPGHRDFIKNTVRGFLQSDLAIWVVDQIPDPDAVYGRSSSFYEAPLLMSGSNMKHALVVINKMDEHDWNTARFDEAKIKITDILTRRHIKTDNVLIVPVSAATGWNLEARTVVPADKQKLDDIRVTYRGPTLWEALIKLGSKTPKRPPKKPFRMSVVKMWNTTLAPGQGMRGIILGTVLQGGIKLNQKISLSPIPKGMEYKKELEVSGIGAGKIKRNLAPPGYLVTLILPPGNKIPQCHKSESDGSGWIAYNPAKETAPETRYFIAKIILFVGKKLNPAAPSTNKFGIHQGYQPIFHFVGGSFRGEVRAIHEELDLKTGKVLQQKPKAATGGKLYKMTITTKAVHIIEPFTSNKQFGRFFITDNGWLLGAGIVVGTAASRPTKQVFGSCTNTAPLPGAHQHYWAPQAQVAYIPGKATIGTQPVALCTDCFFQSYSADPSILERAFTN